MRSFLWSRSLVAVLAVACLVIAGCSANDDEGLPPVSVEDREGDPAASETASSGADSEAETDEPGSGSVESDPDDLRLLWSQLWVASGLVPEERGAAVAELGDSLDPAVAAAIPEVVLVPEEREVLSDPVLVSNADGSVDIRDCVLYTPPIKGFFAPHIHEGHAVPDGDGGWIIDEAAQVGQGCVPAAMAEEVLSDYDEYIQALKDSGKPPDPDHPGLSATMTGTYLEGVVEGTQQLKDENWYYEDFDTYNPEIVELPASTLVVIRDCIESNLDSGIFEAEGVLRNGASTPEPGRRALTEVRMRLEGGQWKAERNTYEGDECEIAPTPFALPEI